MRKRRGRFAFEAMESRQMLSSTELISYAVGGTSSGPGRSELYDVKVPMSADGNRVIFLNDPDDPQDPQKIYVRDRATGVTMPVNVTLAGTPSSSATHASITPDGRYVVFASNGANMTTFPDTFTFQIYVRDLDAGTTTLVSVNLAGTAAGNNQSVNPVITPDGRYVAFESYATDLVVEGNKTGPTRTDIFVRDLLTGTTTLVSRSIITHTYANSASSDPRISDDGQTIAYASTAGDLDWNDTNGIMSDFYVWRASSVDGVSELVDIGLDGKSSANALTRTMTMTPNGRWIAFRSYANNLVANPVSGASQLYIRDLQLKTTTLVTVTPTGVGGNGGDGAGTPGASSGKDRPKITPDGRYVMFLSGASDLTNTPGDEKYSADIFVRDLQTGVTQMVSVRPDGTASERASAFEPDMSDDGRYVAFCNFALDLADIDSPIPPSSPSLVYVRDLQTQTTRVASLTTNGEFPLAGAQPARISRDGSTVIFRGALDLFVPGSIDSNHMTDIFAWPGSTIVGKVFSDANSNGVRDAGEAAMPGVVVYIDANNNAQLDAGERSAATFADGHYFFNDLAAGTYIVRQVLPAGHRRTSPSPESFRLITIADGQYRSGNDFGNTTNIRLAGKVFNDANANGVIDAGENGIAGVVVNIVSNNAIVATRTTDASGGWQVKGLSMGAGRAEIVLPGGYVATLPTGGSYLGSMSSGQQNTNLNFGVVQAGTSPLIDQHAVISRRVNRLDLFDDELADA